MGKEYEIEDDIDYTATLDIERYRHELVHNPELHHTDFFYYEIKTPKVMYIGDNVTFKQKKFYVYSYEAEYIRGELIYTYRLCRENGIWQEKIYNDKLKGISLEGTVLEVSGEQVKLHLNIDKTQEQGKAAWFRYAPPTGNIMYSMPIVGTSANLYFPNERNEEPIVIGCVRKNGSSCEKFSDVNNRYFSTESGNNLDMLPDAINFSRPGLSANFNDGSGITLSSSSSLSINAGYVGMFAGNISITGTEKLVAEKGSSIISLENDFYNSASIVKENGSDRTSNEPFDDDPQNGAVESKATIEAAQFDVVELATALDGAAGTSVNCLSNENNKEYLNIDLRDTLNKPWANADMNGTKIKDGYDSYRESMYKYCKSEKPDATDSEILGYIANQAPLEYKFKAVWNYISNYSPIAQFGVMQKQLYVNSAINNGFDSQASEIYGQLYGDYSQCMLFETGSAIAGNGIKAASALKSGEALSEDEIIAGSGLGNYKKVFFDAHPKLKGKVWVHHGVEQQVLRKPQTKGLFTTEEINSLDNLRGIPKEVNSDIHLSKIRKEWNRFYKEYPNPTKEQLLNKRREIDVKYGKSFNPPIIID